MMKRSSLLLLTLITTLITNPLPALSQSSNSQVNPATIRSLEEQADQAYANGDATQSTFYYSQLLRYQPNNYKYQVRLAIALLNSGPEFLDQAHQAFFRSFELNPRSTEALVFLARIDEALERNAQALEAYQQILKLEPNNQEAFIAIQRLNGTVTPPPLPENLSIIQKRSLEEYLTALGTNSTEIAGLDRQLSIIKSREAQKYFPYLNFGYNRSSSDGFTLEPVAPIFSSGPLEPIFERRVSEGSGNSFSVNLGWNLGNLFFSDNKIRQQGVANQLQDAKERLNLETTRLYVARQNIIQEFQELAWRVAMKPEERNNINRQKRDRYLQIFYITQQLYRLTKIY